MKLPAWFTDRRLWKFLIALALVVFVIFTRVKYHDHYLYSWDSVQFALSIEHFDVTKHQPHPPGYLLYSFTLRLLNQFIGDPNLSSVALNIAATICACLFLALLIFEFTENWIAAAGAAWIFATNPVAWLYGSVAEIYEVEAFFTAVICYSVIASFRRPKMLIWAAIATAIAGGFRPTTELFLLPLFIAAFFGKDRRTFLISVALWLVINVAWLLALISVTGGFETYFNVLMRQTAISFDVGRLPAQLIPLMMLQAITIPALLVLVLLYRRIRFNKKLWLLLLALTPALCFFIFGQFPKHGYLLIVILPLIAISVVLLERATGSGLLMIVALIGGCLLNHSIFVDPPRNAQQTILDFCTPNRHFIRAQELRMDVFFKQINRINGRKAFVIEGFYFPDWRITSYYHPNDQAILLQPARRRAFVAAHHDFKIEKPPFEIDPDAETIICISKDNPGIDMDHFESFEYRYFYTSIEDLPHQFQLYGLKFHH